MLKLGRAQKSSGSGETDVVIVPELEAMLERGEGIAQPKVIYTQLQRDQLIHYVLERGMSTTAVARMLGMNPAGADSIIGRHRRVAPGAVK